MIKSISKMIVTGMALALALPMANAQAPVKASSRSKAPVATQASWAQPAQAAPKALKVQELSRKGSSKSVFAKVRNTRYLNAAGPRFAAPQYVAATTPIIGSLIYSAEDAVGMYSIPTDGASNAITCLAEGEGYNVSSAVLVDGKYYANFLYTFWGYIFGNYNYVFDAETWELIESEEASVEDLSNVGFDMAYDETTGKAYGCFYNSDASGYIFGTWNINTFKTTPICSLDEPLFGVACDAQGVVYGIDKAGYLYTINKTTGDMTLVGNTGVPTQYLSSATMDTKTGRLYWHTVSDDGAALYEINPATADATLLIDFDVDCEFVGLAVPKPLAEDGAPSSLVNFAANFEAGSLAGTITFNLPTITFDGKALEGNLDYVVKVNNEVVAQSTAAAGAAVEVAYTAAESGNIDVLAYATNAVGDGPKSTVSVWVGNDAPVAPKNVALAYADGQFTLTWDPVEAGIHDGFVGDVTYNIVRYTGDEAEVVKEGYAQTTFTEPMAVPAQLTAYYYTVEAVANGLSSAIAGSNIVSLGNIVPPYEVEFTDPESILGYTIVDVNADGRTWELYGDALSVGYNASEDMDDWAFTPAIAVEANKMYEFYIDVKAGSSTWAPETIEVMAGNAANADAMTMTVVPSTDIYDTDYIRLEGAIVAETTGDIYVGLHGKSAHDMLRLYVHGLGISAGANAKAPNAVADLKVTPDYDGALKATVSFVAPAMNILGEPITSISKVEIARDGAVVATLNSVTVGTACSVVDEVPAAGTYKYTVTAFNEEGTGKAASASAFVGVPVPAAPTNAKVVETANLGEVTITWDAVEESNEGAPLNPALVKYTIIDFDGNIIVTDLAATTYTYQAIPAEDMEFVYFMIIAETEAGESVEAAQSNMIAVGTPETLPWTESFDDAGISHPLGVNEAGGGEWNIFDNETFSDLVDCDGTGGFAAMNCGVLDGYADLFTGKIALDATAPALSFMYYSINENDDNLLRVFVTAAGEEPVEVASIRQGDGVAGQWNPCMIPLNEFAGKSVQITFEAVTLAYVYTFIDAIKIAQLPDYDLQVLGIDAPAQVNPGDEFTVVANVLSMGALTTSDYTVELYNNDKLVATLAGREIATGETRPFAFDQTLGMTAAERNVYVAKVVCAGDENLEDNEAETSTIVVFPNYPKATDLSAIATENGVDLSWNEPDMNNLPKVAVTDDFESYSAFAYTNVGDWTLVDNDGSPIGGVSGVQFGDIVAGTTTAAYFVMNCGEESPVYGADQYAAHSGDQYMCATFNYDGSQQSDWLITPQLSGDSQDITFYAKSFSSTYGLESFRVLYSTTTPEVDEFIELAKVSSVPAEWTEYSYHVPSGALYFAIECVSKDIFMFFVDDVTYVPATGEAMELSLVGYNIYRNGVKINDEPVAETTYVDANGKAGDEYVITVVYTVGESAPCEAVEAGSSSINDMVAGAAVKVEGRTIVVTNAAAAVKVYGADGKMIYSEAAAARHAVNVVPGVYVVEAGKLTTKVIVK